ncbi:MAG: hypothetical protein JW804_07040 [Sedimentisphaerales bacterium]|nr:hypothetical protein [Sedimentisphaerales bacterium]
MPEKEKDRTKEDNKNVLGKRTLKNEDANTSEKTTSENEQINISKKKKENKKARLIECLSNLTALHKVQGALMAQMEQNID